MTGERKAISTEVVTCYSRRSAGVQVIVTTFEDGNQEVNCQYKGYCEPCVLEHP